MSVVPLFDSQIFILARPGAGVAERFLSLRLERLPRIYRVAFAAACVERHAPRLRMEVALLVQGSEEFGIGLDLIWESALHQGIDQAWLASMLQPCADPYRRQAAGGEDSISTMLGCLEVAISGDSEAALRVSRCVVRSLEEQATVAARQLSRQAQLQWPSPRARLERERQFRDLSELQHTASAPSVNLVRRLRDRAAMEAGLAPDETAFEPAQALRGLHQGHSGAR